MDKQFLLTKILYAYFLLFFVACLSNSSVLSVPNWQSTHLGKTGHPDLVLLLTSTSYRNVETRVNKLFKSIMFCVPTNLFFWHKVCWIGRDLSKLVGNPSLFDSLGIARSNQPTRRQLSRVLSNGGRCACSEPSLVHHRAMMNDRWMI